MLQQVLHPISTLSKLTGTPEDALLGLFVILSSYPLALLWNTLFNGGWKNVNPIGGQQRRKHLFSIVASGLILYNFFSWGGLLHVLFSLGITRLITHYWFFTDLVPKVYKQYGAWLVFSIVMLQVSYLHVEEQFADELDSNSGRNVFGITAPMMVLVIKLVSYSWACFDGYLGKQGQQISEDRMERRVEEEAGLLEWLGYGLFFGGFFAGPAFEFMDYRNFCRGTLIPRVNPSPIKATLQTLFMGFGCITLYALFGDVYGFPAMTTKWYKLLPLWKRIALVPFLGFTARCKYYAAWKLAEGGCILCGLGWNGTKPNPSSSKAKQGFTPPPTPPPVEIVEGWKRLTNVEPWNVETATSLKVLLDNWNINTQSWLKRCIFDRVGGKKMNKVVATYATSAVWHGFYPGYYLTFFGGGVLTTLAGSLRSLIRPFFKSKASPYNKYGNAYDVFTCIITQYWLNYIVVPFVLLEWKITKDSYTNVYWYGHVGVLLAVTFIKLYGRQIKSLQRRMGLVEPRQPKVEAKVVESKLE